MSMSVRWARLWSIGLDAFPCQHSYGPHVGCCLTNRMYAFSMNRLTGMKLYHRIHTESCSSTRINGFSPLRWHSNLFASCWPITTFVSTTQRPARSPAMLLHSYALVRTIYYLPNRAMMNSNVPKFSLQYVWSKYVSCMTSWANFFIHQCSVYCWANSFHNSVIIRICLIVGIVIAGMKLLSVYATLIASACATYIEYSTVTGYFLQDDNSTNATTFDYVSHTIHRKPYN